MTAPDDAYTRTILRVYGATAPQIDELLVYAPIGFAGPDGTLPSASAGPLALPDEPFVEAWEKYAAEAENHGAATVLRGRLAQLRFPIAEGMSQQPAYVAATRRGHLPEESAAGLPLRRPDRVRLFLHPTAAGRIPVIIASEREDFVSLLRALVYRNEPVLVRPSQGACIVGGYNNWDRVAALRREWEHANPGMSRDGGWAVAFRDIVPQRELYQDRFILLSEGPYSAVPGAVLDLADPVWRRLSLTIRLEHECAHYFTRRVLGSMRNSFLDELIADYAGIVAALGRFDASWFLRFMGLEDFPHFRQGGRLAQYRGTPPLSDGAFAVLRSLVVDAAHALERFCARAQVGEVDPAAMVAIARTGIFVLASPNGDRALEAEYRSMARRPLPGVAGTASARAGQIPELTSRGCYDRAALVGWPTPVNTVKSTAPRRPSTTEGEDAR